MAAAQYATYSHPGAQAGVGQGFANQNAGPFVQGSQGAEYAPAGSYPAGGYAFYLDELSHTDNRPAGAAAEVAGNYGAEAAEPIFSDVSDLDPVYTFKSRSRYSQGRATFFHSHYEPAEHPVMPIYQSVRAVNVPAVGNVQTNVQANDQMKGGHWRFYW